MYSGQWGFFGGIVPKCAFCVLCAFDEMHKLHASSL